MSKILRKICRFMNLNTSIQVFIFTVVLFLSILQNWFSLRNYFPIFFFLCYLALFYSAFQLPGFKCMCESSISNYSYNFLSLKCSFYRGTVVPPLSHPRYPSGCLKPLIIQHPIQTMLFLIHTYPWWSVIDNIGRVKQYPNCQIYNFCVCRPL